MPFGSHVSIFLIPVIAGLAGCASAAPKAVKFIEMTPGVLVLATATGNVVASVGPDGALLCG